LFALLSRHCHWPSGEPFVRPCFMAALVDSVVCSRCGTPDLPTSRGVADELLHEARQTLLLKTRDFDMGSNGPPSNPQSIPTNFLTSSPRICQDRPASAGLRGIGTLNATLDCLREEEPRGFVARSADQKLQSGTGTTAASSTIALSALHLSLDISGGSLASLRSVAAELSCRRKAALQGAFRRLDVSGRGWVSIDELSTALISAGSLSPSDQALVVLGVSNAGFAKRITFSHFASYYRILSGAIALERDFEALLRYHWGFNAVSDILDDMKNKFALVGLAFTFRETMQKESGTNGEIDLNAFKQHLEKVGMAYDPRDLKRVFDAFASGGDPLGFLNLSQQLTSAARPSTPVGSAHLARRPVLGGTAHLSEIGTGSLNGTGQTLGSTMNSIHGHLTANGELPPCPAAPPERPEKPDHDYHAVPPEAPSEDGYEENDTRPPPPENDEEGEEALPLTHPAPPEGDGSPQHVDDTAMAPREEPVGLEALPSTHPAPPEGKELPQHLEDTMAAPPEKVDGDDADLPRCHVAPSEEDEDDGDPKPQQAPPEANDQDVADLLPLPFPAPPEEDEDGDMAPGDEASVVEEEAEDLVQAPDEGAPAPAVYYSASPNGEPHAPLPQTVADVGAVASPSAMAAPVIAGGRRKAVSVGINYLGHRQGVLSSCINDSDTFIDLLTHEFGYNVQEIRQLRDDHPQRMPTRRNITTALRWLVEGAAPDDHLFFHYSGHGSQQVDPTGDERDGRDATLVPCDYQQNGMLADDELRSLLVSPLPKGVRLTCVLDCCHGGSAMGLPFQVVLAADGQSVEVRKKPSKLVGVSSKADVVMISGCMDRQTSAEVGAGTAGNSQPAGAMSTAFKSVITADPGASYHRLITQMRAFLKNREFPQVPQLTAEHFVTLTDCFLPESEVAEPGLPAPLRPPLRRAVTIGINYLTLRPGRGRLAGCINDSEAVVGLLKQTLGFQESQICRLRDDRADCMPTKENIMKALRWLVEGASLGDEMFLHYSGHSGQLEDRRGEESEGKDDTLLPCDFQQAGQITDDELYAAVVHGLPKGCRLWVVLDCCHSGTALDLQYKVRISPDGRSATVAKTPRRREVGGMPVQGETTKAEVIMLSGCQDSQTSADLSGSSSSQKAAGAMTTALKQTLTPNVSCHKLTQHMRRYLRRNHFSQVPQMSSEQFVQLDSSFVRYEAHRAAKRAASRTIPGAPPFPAFESAPATPGGDASRIDRLEEELSRLKQQQSMMLQQGFAPLSPAHHTS